MLGRTERLHRRVVVFLAVHDACAGAHDLDVAFADDGGVAHAVLMLQIAGQRNAHDFHVVVRVRPKPGAPGDRVVVQHAQRTEVHALRVVANFGEAEAVVRVEANRGQRGRESLQGGIRCSWGIVLGSSRSRREARVQGRGRVSCQSCKYNRCMYNKNTSIRFIAQQRGRKAPLFIRLSHRSEVLEVFPWLDVLECFVDEADAVLHVVLVHHFHRGVHVAQGEEIEALGTPWLE